MTKKEVMEMQDYGSIAEALEDNPQLKDEDTLNKAFALHSEEFRKNHPDPDIHYDVF